MRDQSYLQSVFYRVKKIVRPLALLLCAFSVLSFTFCLGLGIGIMSMTRQFYHREYLKERELIEPIIARNPAFSGITIHEKSDGGVFIDGCLSSTDYSQLRFAITQVVGESRADEIVMGILVKP
jgi:hypothetical protein